MRRATSRFCSSRMTPVSPGSSSSSSSGPAIPCSSPPPPAEALDLVAAGGIELIVLDQQLPSGQSGLDLFRQIKDAGHDMPAILVTGLQDENLLVEALRAGVRDFVPKTPNFLNHLEPIVSRVIRQVSTERDLAESRIVTAQSTRPRRRELEHEIAQRKRVEQALREAEENLRLMVESIKDFAIFTVDPKTACVVSWNSGAEQLFGYSEEEILGQSIAVIFPPEDRAALVPEQEIATAAANGRATDERWHIRKDGSRFFASGVLAPIFDEESKLRGFTKICPRHHRAKAGRRCRSRGGRPAQGDRRHRRRRHHHDRRKRHGRVDEPGRRADLRLQSR